MSTKLNIQRNKDVEKLERATRRKLNRLKEKGINTGSISPLRSVDKSDTRALGRYQKELKEFTSRKTQFVRGSEGSAIPAAQWREYQKLEKRWNVLHDKYWRKNKNVQLVNEDMTLLQKAGITSRKTMFGAIDYQRSLELEKVKGPKDLERRMAILKRETSPDYAVERAKKMVEHMHSALSEYNDKRLNKALEQLSVKELVRLQNESLFVEDFFLFNYGWTDEEWQQHTDYLLNIMKSAQLRGARTKKQRQAIEAFYASL